VSASGTASNRRRGFRPTAVATGASTATDCPETRLFRSTGRRRCRRATGSTPPPPPPTTKRIDGATASRAASRSAKFVAKDCSLGTGGRDSGCSTPSGFLFRRRCRTPSSSCASLALHRSDSSRALGAAASASHRSRPKRRCSALHRRFLGVHNE